MDRPTVTDSSSTLKLEPLGYQRELRDYLRLRDRETWDWLASNRLAPSFAERVRMDVLSSTYRLTATTEPELYKLARDVADRMEFAGPVTIYQAPATGAMNAVLAFSPTEIHLVLYGPVQKSLTSPELLSLMAHEFAHHRLWSGWEQNYFVVDQLLHAAVEPDAATAVYQETLRCWNLFTELFCDRAALEITSDPLVVISMLVKMLTGLAQVDSRAYIAQVSEVLQAGSDGSKQWSHPEAYLRAWALHRWSESGAAADAEVADLVLGPRELDSLDVLSQLELHNMTRALLDALLAPDWFRSAAVLALARSYFPDYEPTAWRDDAWSRFAALAKFGPTVHDYLCFVLLDFAHVDRDLEDHPLAAAIRLADRLRIKDRFIELARRELRLRKKQLEAIEAGA